MLKKYFSDKKNEFMYSILLNISFLLAFKILFYPRFESEIDILMQSAVYGIMGITSSYIIYSNIIIGKLLMILLSIFPGVPWYIIFHYILIFVSLCIITYITIKRNGSFIGKVIAGIISAFVGYQCYVIPNYMKTSVLLSVCAAYLFWYAYEMKAKKKIIGVLCFSLLSSMVCLSAFIISAIIGFTIVFLYCLFQKCGREWKRWICITLVSMITLVSAARVLDSAVYTFNNRDDKLTYRNSMEKILGYGIPKYSDNMLDEYQLDEVSYKNISQGLFFSEEDEQFELIKKISDEKREFSWNTISRFFKEVPITLFKTGMFYYIVVLCAIVLLTEERKKMIIGTLLLLLLEYFLFYIFNSWEYAWISFMIILPTSLLLLIKMKDAMIGDKESLIAYLIVLSVILYSNFSSTMPSSVNEDGIEALTIQVNPDYIYMVDMVEYLRLSSVFKVYDSVNLPPNVYLANGAYGLMDEFINWTNLEKPTEGMPYYWLYNPSGVTVESVFFE